MTPYDTEDQISFFNVALDGFYRAQRDAARREDRFYNIGGFTVKLAFAGNGLPPFVTPALAHLPAPPSDAPALTVCLWDSASTHTPLPLIPASIVELIHCDWTKHLGPRKELTRYHGERIYTAYHIGPNILSILDTQRNIAAYWIDDAQRIPYFEHGSPLQTILNWWTALNGHQYVHAGAVGTESGCVLLAGKGGSGKSTSTLASISGDLQYLADDYCLVATCPEPFVYSLYNTAKLNGEADLQRFPHLRELVQNPVRGDDEKAVLFLAQHFPDQIAAGLPLRGIVVPHIRPGSKTAIADASPIEALRALAPSTLFQLSGTGTTALGTMSALARSVPCYKMTLGADIETIPRLIRSLLDR